MTYHYPAYEAVRFTRPDGTSWVWNLDTDRIQSAIEQHPDCDVECVDPQETVDFDRAARAAMASGPELQWREVLPRYVVFGR